jgi:hypothetical protein
MAAKLIYKITFITTISNGNNIKVKRSESFNNGGFFSFEAKQTKSKKITFEQREQIP